MEIPAAASESDIIFDIQRLAEDVSFNGGYIHENVEFRISDEEGVGVFANANLAPGTLLIKVPFSLCLSVDMVSGDEHLSKVLREQQFLKEMPDEILALGIMYACNEANQCEWSNHIRTFPKSINSTIFWADEELNELKLCNVYYLTNIMKRRLESDWQNMHEPLMDQYPHLFSKNTIELYKWALSMVYSRAIGITRNYQYVRCIPLLIDMANHCVEVGHDSSDTFSFNDEENAVHFYNTLPLPANSECYASYGNYSNSKLAYTYGFVLANNPVKAIDLWTRVSPSTSFNDIKQKTLDSYELTKNQTYDFVGTIRSNQFISSALLTTIRVIQLDENEIDNIGKVYYDDKKMVTVRNEMATYVALRNLIVAKMKPEFAESDRKELGELLLNNTPLNNRKLIALIIRTDERTLYEESLVLIDELISELTTLGEDYLPPDAITASTPLAVASTTIEDSSDEVNTSITPSSPLVKEEDKDKSNKEQAL